MIEYIIKNNGNTICKAVVDESDLLEVALAKLVGDDISILNVSALISSSDEHATNSVWETSKIEVGDEITILIQDTAVKFCSNVIGELENEFGNITEENLEPTDNCAFCDKKREETPDIISGKNANICKECIELCSSMYKT